MRNLPAVMAKLSDLGRDEGNALSAAEHGELGKRNWAEKQFVCRTVWLLDSSTMKDCLVSLLPEVPI